MLFSAKGGKLLSYFAVHIHLILKKKLIAKQKIFPKQKQIVSNKNKLYQIKTNTQTKVLLPFILLDALFIINIKKLLECFFFSQ